MHSGCLASFTIGLWMSKTTLRKISVKTFVAVASCSLLSPLQPCSTAKLEISGGKFKQIWKLFRLRKMCAFRVMIKLIILILHFRSLKCCLKLLDISIKVVLFQNHKIKLLQVLYTILFTVAL